MSFESLTNRGEYLSAHYLAEILPTTLKGGLLKRWAEEEKDGRVTPRAGLRGMRRDYFNAKAELTDLKLLQPEAPEGEVAERELIDPERLRKQHNETLRRLGFDPRPQVITVERAGQEHQIPVAHAELDTAHGIVAFDCGWAVDTDAAQDPDGPGRLLEPVALASNETIATGAKLASWLFAADNPPRYVLILSGGVITLADRSVWGEGRYLAVSLDTAYARNDEKELDVIAALFGADSLRPPAEGGTEPLADLVAGSRQHAVGVSSELREGLRVSVELIANEVLDRIRQAGYQPQQVMELDELAKELGREALRYLYRILFLLYAEARPELGVLPVDDPEYVEGYSLARLGDLISRRLAPSAEGGFHLYESLDLLFRMVNEGHRPPRVEAAEEKVSESEGLRFEPMKSDLFLPEKTKLIGRLIPYPDSDPDDPDGQKIDTRLRNKVLYEVLRRLMLTKGAKKRRGGFISYAQLGINQLGAVYEGLMSYTGFVATEQLYEVAKGGDPKDGSWMIPASKVDEYDDSVFVYKENPYTGVRSRVTYAPGQFVYRLAGRDRQTSASYYTPQSLTEVTVQLALKYRLDQDGTVTKARELLDWTICEPALGSGAFLNEAINQVAAEYLRRRQEELEFSLDPEEYHHELQRVKAYIALHNCYGVDLNRTAVELAEVSLWLNVMHTGLRAPWFGLHLRRGNSLIGGRRQTYTPKQLADKSWLTVAPKEQPFRHGPIDEGTIHHFLLPADGWGEVAGEKQARELAPVEAEKLRKWRTAMKHAPSAKGKASQVARLQALARRVEFLWGLVQRRLEISEREIRRHIPVWGADDLVPVDGAVPREKILADLETPGTPYWRLKTLMDVWCGLWFWPLDAVGLLDGSADEYASGNVEVTQVREIPQYEEPVVYQAMTLDGIVESQQPKRPKRIGTRKVPVSQQLRRQVPLRDLDDWVSFAEALIGRADIPADSLVAHFSTLAELGDFEAELPSMTGMDEPYRLLDRFPWLGAAELIAEQQGFFHWELAFAHAFSKGGFDIQVGNPPWVRPQWDETAALAEFDPWVKLTQRASPAEVHRRKMATLSEPSAGRQFAREWLRLDSYLSFLASPQTYPLLVGTQTDLYRAFMCKVWTNADPHGTIGLVHPDTHFTGMREAPLRRESYKRLRIHGDFVNPGHRFFPEPVGESSHFGVHIYGSTGVIGFDHLSWLFSTEALLLSEQHDGQGDPPGVRYKGVLDERPHKARIVRVDQEVLALWQQLLGDAGDPVETARLLSPVSTAEARAIASLAQYPVRLQNYGPQIASGFHESNAKKAGIIEYCDAHPAAWREVILKGPQIGVATPIFKGPNPNTNEAFGAELIGMDVDYVPPSEYRRALDWHVYERSLERVTSPSLPHESSPYIDFYRMAWRKMIAPDTERSLYASILPPGPAHVNGIKSAVISSNRVTALTAGFWASLPMDYLLRITGVANLDVSNALKLFAPVSGHPLAEPLLVRTLRLNCLTAAYGNLWRELYDPAWAREQWVCSWPNLSPLQDVVDEWTYETPLRSDHGRRSAMVEMDALVAVWLGVDIESLLAMYRARFPVLWRFEEAMWFDATGRKISGNHRSYGHRQVKGDYERLLAHLDDPERNPVPEGYRAPFYKADRESEYRQAHAVFSKRLQDAIDGGWQPS
ncbi:restriction endonuclease [Micromonospora globispora]|uniref:site-specific DNA-methyltransferase (adenine-specific) n=1 Tax=Micromonospora globispora TaxID=1450148 RepID=A0A317K4Y1_9ACTN|nr:restriction endonuclease [Micromonospora globispora]PWU48056.1 restriction endonuclease [Micromonospora globispora]